jgi:hypothetical protein
MEEQCEACGEIQVGGWDRVKVFAPVGYRFGVVKNRSHELELVLRAPGDGDWAHGVQPVGGEAEILEGNKGYVVMLECK